MAEEISVISPGNILAVERGGVIGRNVAVALVDDFFPVGGGHRGKTTPK